MEEKVLIKSERYRTGIIIIMIVTLVIGALISGIIFSAKGDIAMFSEWYDEDYATYLRHNQNKDLYDDEHIFIFDSKCTDDDKCHHCQRIEEYPIKLFYIIHYMTSGGLDSPFEKTFIPLIPFFVSVLISIFVLLWLRSQELTVTDKRVYGKAAFGKRVDLPLDSVSAVATISALKGITVGTSSGKISFMLMKNQGEIHALISKLLLERQKDKKSKPETQEANFTNADEIKKYKELLENGAITQEEFEAKKKQLLGL